MENMKHEHNSLSQLPSELLGIECDLAALAGSLEVLEATLYTAQDRTDKDLTKPCAYAADILAGIAHNLHDRVQEMGFRYANASKTT
jgi:hypothetical protein